MPVVLHDLDLQGQLVPRWKRTSCLSGVRWQCPGSRALIGPDGRMGA